MAELDLLESWIAEIAPELGISPADIDIALILDLARDAAHNVARPAAPLTTFLVGLAAGLRGGSLAAIQVAAATAQRVALEHGAQTDGAQTRSSAPE